MPCDQSGLPTVLIGLVHGSRYPPYNSLSKACSLMEASYSLTPTIVRTISDGETGYAKKEGLEGGSGYQDPGVVGIQERKGDAGKKEKN